MADVKSGDVVVPGDRLCVIEELTPAFGTYERDGLVFAATSGTVSMDLKSRSISVLDHKGRMKLALPVRGDILVGEVSNVYEQRAEVAIVRRNDEDVYSPWVGEVHISNVTRRYVKSMRDVIGQGDIVRAVSLSTHSIPVELSLVGPELGVMLSKCRVCGTELSLTTHNNLVCLKCENRETREVASDYGRRFGIEPRPDLAPKRRTYGGDRERRFSDRSGERRERRPPRTAGRRSTEDRDRRRPDSRRGTSRRR
jgi:exosome complex component CSL4